MSFLPVFKSYRRLNAFPGTAVKSYLSIQTLSTVQHYTQILTTSLLTRKWSGDVFKLTTVVFKALKFSNWLEGCCNAFCKNSNFQKALLSPCCLSFNICFSVSTRFWLLFCQHVVWKWFIHIHKQNCDVISKKTSRLHWFVHRYLLHFWKTLQL